MSFSTGSLSYIGRNSRVMYHGHIPEEEAVVRVGSFTSIAQDCVFFVDGNHRFDHASTFPFYELGHSGDPRNKNGWSKGAPIIGSDVWIGHGVIVLSGARIGDGCVVAAGSVVAGDCPPFSVVAGNPARVVKHRFDQKTIDRLMATRWWDNPTDVVVEKLAPYQHNVGEFIVRAEQLSHNPSLISRIVGTVWGVVRSFITR